MYRNQDSDLDVTMPSGSNADLADLDGPHTLPLEFCSFHLCLLGEGFIRHNTHSVNASSCKLISANLWYRLFFSQKWLNQGLMLEQLAFRTINQSTHWLPQLTPSSTQRNMMLW